MKKETIIELVMNIEIEFEYSIKSSIEVYKTMNRMKRNMGMMRIGVEMQRICFVFGESYMNSTWM